MKTMCPPGYYHNGFVATHALGHMMYCYILLVPMNQGVLNKLSKERKSPVRFEHSVCLGSLMTTYILCVCIYIYIYIIFLYMVKVFIILIP